MGHTSTRKGSPVLLRMVPNTSHRKVMKPSQRSTSCCCSSSRTVKSFCRGTREHVSLTGAGRGPGNTSCPPAPTVHRLILCFNEDKATLPCIHSITCGYLNWGHSFFSSESCLVLATFLLHRCSSAWKIPRLQTGNVVVVEVYVWWEEVGKDTILGFITSQFNLFSSPLTPRSSS